ncbi:CRISPR-associated protein Cas5 [Streptomyces sp. NBC_01803]|uniref:CRISPR-associated protein Cas5 n=1 Tax=Streptomyces sp. NBC_01803 TaxID=2975946 RepID=UPI002DD9620E|nr:CRISPR-associated protein Cas5 [Streptomyces sp. NBC_01803]WSA47544.1 CRISPR-associated protein Cas5 [Streptomyces sp. NBC_01803]
MPTGRSALEVTVTAPVVSFRNPLYSGVQVTLPCPSPATVGGMLAAAAGGWGEVDPGLSFAMVFHARGGGTDLETYHPLEATGKKAPPAPRSRDFLADVMLRLWLFEDLEAWERRLRRPRWPLRLGRSQDLVGIRLDTVAVRQSPGTLGGALVPESATDPAAGTRLRMPAATSTDRNRTRWGSYLFDPTGRSARVIEGSWSTAQGQALVPLASPHPDTAPPST